MLEKIKKLADYCDSTGKIELANKLDEILLKYAQESQQTEKKEDNGIQTTYKMFKELHEFYRENLEVLNYLGEDKVQIIINAFDQFMNMFKIVLKNVKGDQHNESIDSYRAHLRKNKREVDRSAKMRVTPTKLKVDKFLFFDELEVMISKLERIYEKNKEVNDLNQVIKKARVVLNSFSNVLKQTSEEIANMDLLENN